MLIAVIPVTDYASAERELQLAQQASVDGIELRLDYLKNLDISRISNLRAACHLPVIFTLRKKSQGGLYAHNEDQRLDILLDLCRLNPDYLDIEYDTATDFLQKLSQDFPQIKLICSYHNFEYTPEDLDKIFQSMQAPYFTAYKIATQANNTVDALRMLQFSQNINQQQHNFTGICMGEDGQCTRILSPVINNYFHYAILNQEKNTASGQLSIDELITIYHFRQLTNTTKIYAVLGNPVNSSVGYILHNRAIRIMGENAVYIKLRLTADELPAAIALCRHLPFAGFSITMPLKEATVALLDEVDPTAKAIAAINTIALRQQCYIGFNTDGKGAVQALAEVLPLNKQTIIIIGAGGAARAIAYIAHQQGAKIIILNRTLAKAQKLAAEVAGQAEQLTADFDLNKWNYTTLVNTLPASAYAEKNLQALTLQPNRLAMDIVYRPLMTPFLKWASEANYHCIAGSKMYINQALQQIQHWYDPSPSMLSAIKEMMRLWFDALSSRTK